MRRQILAATFWSAGDLLARQGVQFGVSLVLARLLTPSDFGVMAMLSVFTSFASVLADGGFSLALIQRRDTNHEDESSVFWFNLCVSAVLALLLCSAGPLIANFYHTPGIESLTCFIALTIIASAAGSIHFALLAKRLEFHLQAKAGGISAAVSGCVAIAMAIGDFGIWALAAQSVLMAILTTVLLWRFNRWRPTFTFSGKSLRKLSTFGSFQLMNSLMEMTYSRLYVLLVGRIFGAKMLGYYANADSLRQLPASFLGGLVTRVAMPMFARANGEPALCRRGVQLGIRMMMMINAPVVAAMVVLSRPMVNLLFGTKWLPAAALLQIMAVAMLFYPLHAINVQALLGLGHTRRMFVLEVVKKLFGMALLFAGLGFGMAGVLWSQVVHSCVALVINAYFSKRWFGYGALAQLLDVMPSLVAATFAAVIVAIIRHWILSVSILSQLLICMIAGGICYVATLAVIGRGTWRDAKELVKELRK